MRSKKKLNWQRLFTVHNSVPVHCKEPFQSFGSITNVTSLASMVQQPHIGTMRHGISVASPTTNYWCQSHTGVWSHGYAATLQAWLHQSTVMTMINHNHIATESLCLPQTFQDRSSWTAEDLAKIMIWQHFFFFTVCGVITQEIL